MARQNFQNPKNLTEANDAIRADYSAAKMTRFKRVRTGMLSTIGTGADYHYRIQSEFLRMMEYSRDMDRNDAVIGQMVDRACLNTIQDGLTPSPQTGDEILDRDLRYMFDEWAEDADACDTAGESTFYDQQFQALRASHIDGDMLALPTDDGQLQLIEAHRLRTPSGTKRNVVHGVLLNDYRKRIEYWFTKNDVDPYKTIQFVSEIDPVPARDADGFKRVFHVYNPKRISQTRGVTSLAPCFDIAGMLDDINFSAVVRQQIANVFALVRERSENFRFGSEVGFGEVTTENMPGGTSRQLQNVAPGMEVAGAPGETLKFDGAKVPSNEFFQHIRLMLQLIGVNLGMPLIMVLMDASDTNFSGWRGAMDQAKLGFKHNQRWMARKLCRPVYQWKLRQFISRDLALARQAKTLGVKFFAHRWHFPEWPYINPAQDAAADAMRLEKRLTSPRRIAAEKNMDHVDLINETVEDNSRAISRAIKEAMAVEASTGVKVEWRDFLFIQNNGPINVAPAAPPGAKPKPGKSAPEPDGDEESEDTDDNGDGTDAEKE